MKHDTKFETQEDVTRYVCEMCCGTERQLLNRARSWLKANALTPKATLHECMTLMRMAATVGHIKVEDPILLLMMLYQREAANRRLANIRMKTNPMDAHLRIKSANEDKEIADQFRKELIEDGVLRPRT